MRELPRQLTVDELAALFEGRTRFVERLAGVPDPLQAADELVAAMPEEELVEALAAHPRIGARRLSPRSSAEQGAEPVDPAVETELAYLNQVYEEKFGFRFVVFVAGRPKREILEVLRERIGGERDDELRTAARELVAIARDRWERG